MIGPDVIQRFESKFTKRSGCWIWESATVKGYGVLQLSNPDRILAKAPRLAWTIYRGEIPDGIQVLHHCDNPLCVNPDHLFLGTHTDNMRDASQKGRLPGNVNAVGQPPGETHPMSKLTAKAVAEIRALCSDGSTKQGEIASRYGISQQQVSKIKRGDRWSCEIPNPVEFAASNARREEIDLAKMVEVKELIASGMQQKEIAKKVGFSQQKISMIKHGKIEKYA